MEASSTAGSQDDAFGPDDVIFLSIEIVQDGTGSLSVPVKEQFDSR